MTSATGDEELGADSNFRRFNTNWIPRYPIEANGHSIAKMWATEAVSYLSIGVPNSMVAFCSDLLGRLLTPTVPNYFMMGGPYGPLGHGSFLPIIETLASNVIQCVKKMQKDRIKSLTPR